MSRPFCIRCLIRDTCNADMLKIIDDYKLTISLENQCNSSDYELRLSICKDCKWLNKGTCTKSGFFVEARAFDKNSHCPLGKKIW